MAHRLHGQSLRKAVLAGVVGLGAAILGAVVPGLAAKPAEAAEWWEQFVDPEDGKFDVSGLLSRGGFIPVPIIITEPAVEGGFGIVGQFLHAPSSPNGTPGRTIVGGAITGNDSKGGGLLHQGSLADGRLVYRFGLGLADLTLPIFPFGGDAEIDYGNQMQFGFATVRYRIADTPFSLGPRVIYRTSDVSLRTQGPLADRVTGALDRFTGERQYVALGLSLNYDTRDNSLTPANGVNAIVKYDVYSEALGSDEGFGAGQIAIHGFREMGDAWSFGGRLRLDAVSDDAPFFMAPGVDLRGVQYGRYQGDAALSLEAELRRQVTPRWAALLFGGYGETFVDDSPLYQAESGIWTYGAGIRYRIARKLGIDVGLDVARGPEETIFYIQFGHAWMRTMD